MLISSTINGIDYLVLIPEAMRIQERDSKKSSQKFINFFIYLYGSIGLLLIISVLVSPVFFYSFFSKFNTDLLRENYKLLYIGSIIISFQLLNSLLSALLASYKYFTISILSGLINAVFSITFTIVLHNKIGITGTLLGVSLGYIINFILLIYVLKKFQGWNFFNIGWMKNTKVWKNIALMQVNILPVLVRNYLVIYIITGMNKGAITSINLAQTIAGIPEIFILSQIMAVVGIKFSELNAKRDFIKTNYILQHLATLLFIIIIPISITMAVCSKEIISLALHRGNFNSSASTLTSLCFFYFSLLLPTKIFDTIFTRLFTAFQIYGLSTLIAFIAHVIITTIIYFGITYFKLEGYFTALIFGYAFIMPVVFYLIMKFRFKEMNIKTLIKNFFLFFIIMVIVCFSAIKIKEYLYFYSVVNIIIIAAFSFSAVFVLSYFMVDVKFIIEYLQSIRKKVGQFNK
ncbi:MAG: hypothetical protein IPJ81_03520 [Chitinophagaceae bacterium]|nr:hypothetical protein [Chitinophagaceae bacterium]